MDENDLNGEYDNDQTDEKFAVEIEYFTLMPSDYWLAKLANWIYKNLVTPYRKLTKKY